PQEFAAPGTCAELRCKGRPCAQCHKCRDWHFTGNHDKWNWVCNFKNWKGDDWQRWNDGDYKLFKKRTDGATCDGLDDDDDDDRGRGDRGRGRGRDDDLDDGYLLDDDDYDYLDHFCLCNREW
ncbi:unnamed protein product, partial [Rotaria magnacalcarata]